MIKIKITLIFMLAVQQLSAQITEPINTDRPDQSDGTYVLEKNYLQIENGITIANKTVTNNLMLRYGLTKSTEIRLLSDFGKFEGMKGFTPIGISIKQRLIENKGIVPAITLVGYLRNENIASKAFKSNSTTYNFLLAFQNDITDKLSVGYNIGTATGLKNISFTTSVGYGLSAKFTGFIEYFANFEKKETPSHNIDGGILYLINNRLQLDFAVGSSLIEKGNYYFTTGVSYRFKN
jgi:hypothetical protein